MSLTTSNPANVNVSGKQISSLNLLSQMGQARAQDTVTTFKKKTTQAMEGYHAPFVERRTLLLVVDALLILVAIWFAQQTASFVFTDLLAMPHADIIAPYFYLSPAILGLWWLLASFNDLYDVSLFSNKRAAAMRIGMVGAIGAVIYGGLSFLFVHLPAILPIFYTWTIVLLTILAWRCFYSSLLLNLSKPHRIIVLGTGKRGQTIAKLIQQTSHIKYEMLGYVNEYSALDQPLDGKLSVIGSVTDLVALVEQHNPHEVVVAINDSLTEELFQRLVLCQSKGVQISWMPDLYEKLCYSVPIEYIDPTWALYAMQGQPIFNRLQLMGKRFIDLAIVFFGLPSLLLLIPLLALAIRLDSKGPIFYRQVRTGRGGKDFKIWKFRTMVTDAEKDGVRWASKNDSRITRVGRFLRKTRLDELPQIFNILVGDMSIVGPRPERPEFIELLQKEIPFYHTRLMVKPGLTGWAQVRYDYGNTTEDALFKLHYDFYYIRYWSLWMDFYIIFKTIDVVFKLKGM